jgi:hypothetical protein
MSWLARVPPLAHQVPAAAPATVTAIPGEGASGARLWRRECGPDAKGPGPGGARSWRHTCGVQGAPLRAGLQGAGRFACPSAISPATATAPARLIPALLVSLSTSERLSQTGPQPQPANPSGLPCVCAEPQWTSPQHCARFTSAHWVPEYQSPPPSDLPSAPRPPASPRSSPRCTPPCSRAAGARGSAFSQSLRGSAPRSQQVLAPIRTPSLRRRWRRRQRHRKVPPVPPEAWAAPRSSHFEKFPPVSERASLAVTSAHSPLLRGGDRHACAAGAFPRSRPEVGFKFDGKRSVYD